jgi:hypothetical protein
MTTSLIPRVYNITLRASDKYLTIYKTYSLKTQNMIDFKVDTFPDNTSIIDDSKLFLIHKYIFDFFEFLRSKYQNY